MISKAVIWLCAGLMAVSAVASPGLATAKCPELWSAQKHLVNVSKIARVFRDGIDRVYIDYTRADYKSRIDDLATSRVFAMQSFLTHHLDAVHLNAWQAFELLGESSPIVSRRSAIQVAEYLVTKAVADLDLIERYEYHTGNLYDRVSALARKSLLVKPDADMGSQYGSYFSPLLKSIRKELSMATQALQQIKSCIE